MRLRHLGAAVVAAGIAISGCRSSSLPNGLADAEWWALIETLSESPRPFRLSENLVSNETGYAERIRWLRPTGGVYIGVGPEQNYSYMAALEPEIAFVVDIRRENRNLHLLYKALFELSRDRVDFVCRLFSRRCPESLDSADTIDSILGTVAAMPADTSILQEMTRAVVERLARTRTIPLIEPDVAFIERTLAAFAARGPDIAFEGAGEDHPSYRMLMTERDGTRVQRSFLASNAAFGHIKALHTLNLVVPVVGDFAGSRTLRGIGDFARRRGGTITAFYASNVAVYLNAEGSTAFCANLASLPAAPRAPFLENNRMRPLATRLKDCPSVR